MAYLNLNSSIIDIAPIQNFSEFNLEKLKIFCDKQEIDTSTFKEKSDFVDALNLFSKFQLLKKIPYSSTNWDRFELRLSIQKKPKILEETEFLIQANYHIMSNFPKNQKLFLIIGADNSKFWEVKRLPFPCVLKTFKMKIVSGRPSYWKYLEDFPDFIRVQIQNENGLILLQNDFKYEINIFCQSVFEKVKVKTNILLIGPHNSGKTSFISTCMSIFSKNLFRGLLNISETSQLECFQLDNSNISLWDTWGFGNEDQFEYNLTDDLFKKLWSGNITNNSTPSKIKNIQIPLSQRISVSSIIFFLSPSQLLNSEFIEKIKKFSHILRSNFILVITQKDKGENEENICKKIKELGNDFEYKRVSFFISNYSEQRNKDFEIEKTILGIISKALQASLK